MFSLTTEYALRAVAYLASCDEHTTTVPLMAEAIQVKAPYLRKVINKLGDAQIVESQRGKGGGLRLSVDPNKLTLLEVVNAVDPIQRIEQCPLGSPNHMSLCPLHAELDDAISKIQAALGNRTIGELQKTRRNAFRCGFPSRQELYSL